MPRDRPHRWLALGAAFVALLLAQAALGVFSLSARSSPVGAFSDAPLARAPEGERTAVLAADLVVGVLLLIGMLRLYRTAARRSLRSRQGKIRSRSRATVRRRTGARRVRKRHQ